MTGVPIHPSTPTVETSAHATGHTRDRNLRRKTAISAAIMTAKATDTSLTVSDANSSNIDWSSALVSTIFTSSFGIPSAIFAGRRRYSLPPNVSVSSRGISAADRNSPPGSTPIFAFSAAFSRCHFPKSTSAKRESPIPAAFATASSPFARSGSIL